MFGMLFETEGPVSDAKLEGWLWKKKRKGSWWTKRYFVLDLAELELSWYRSKLSINPSGSICLRSMRSVNFKDPKTLQVESFQRTLVLRAETRQLANYWRHGIALHIKHL